MQSSDSDDDWFNKDESEFLENLQSKINATGKLEQTEYINCPINADELKLDAFVVGSSNNNKSGKHKFNIVDLRKFLEMAPLDMFLHVMSDERDYFRDQIDANDPIDRVMCYTRILATICQMELPGFYEEMLRTFTADEKLLDYYRYVVIKIFSPAYTNDWDEKMQELVDNIAYLLLGAYKATLLVNKGFELLSQLKQSVERCKLPNVKKLSVIVKFEQELALICDDNGAILKQKPNQNYEIYPTLNELLSLSVDNDIEDVNRKEQDTEQSTMQVFDQKYKNVSSYINTQRELLREDFMIPLRSFVRTLKNNQTHVESPNVWEHAIIKLNSEFLDAQRHELVYVDVIGAERVERSGDAAKLTCKERLCLDEIKNGALLCFSTSYKFENIILATVNYTEAAMLQIGHVAIEIVRQYNIGNFYQKKLIMFQTPAFFEPYLRVFNQLSNCITTNFPFKGYIVEGKTQTKPPAYTNAAGKYTYNTQKFDPLNPKIDLPLNCTQKAAFTDALSKDFCLIQGPPGTGKTHLSLEIVKTLIENSNWIGLPIVLITCTNDSLDKCLLKLSKHTDNIVRFGWQAYIKEIAKFNMPSFTSDGDVSPHLKRLYWLVKTEYKKQFDQLQTLYDEFDGTDEDYQQIVAAQTQVRGVNRKLNTIRNIFQYYVARKASIIAMTTTCAAKMNFLFRLLQSKIVIFEEASEILESHVLACLTPYTQHVIMMGDHKQHQPHTSSLEHSHSKNLRISLFERLIQNNFEVSVLSTQYRMRLSIVDLLSPVIYDELRSDSTVFLFPSVKKMSENIYFLTHEHEDTKRKSDFINMWEVEQINKLTNHLLKEGKYYQHDVAVLTPYHKQMIELKLMLGRSEITNLIEVATVDRFQGLEANIILLSLVSTQNSNTVGFLKEPHRVSVALSRAKIGLYMIGNMELLASQSAIWHSIEQKLQERECIGKEFPCVTSE